MLLEFRTTKANRNLSPNLAARSYSRCVAPKKKPARAKNPARAKAKAKPARARRASGYRIELVPKFSTLEAAKKYAEKFATAHKVQLRIVGA